jgi:hypothetical protein
MRAFHALKAAHRLIGTTARTARSCERRARHRPVETSIRLWEALQRLMLASERLDKAAEQLAAVFAWMAVTPDLWERAPDSLRVAVAEFETLSAWLQETANQINALHLSVLEKLMSGELVAEQPRRRRRIAVAPRPSFVRAFLAARQPRTVDRIGPLLRRRRRTPRPAALRVPRRDVLGRAPPLFSLCAL